MRQSQRGKDATMTDVAAWLSELVQEARLPRILAMAVRHHGNRRSLPGHDCTIATR